MEDSRRQDGGSWVGKTFCKSNGMLDRSHRVGLLHHNELLTDLAAVFSSP
jgi:hypothetical protein